MPSLIASTHLHVVGVRAREVLTEDPNNFQGEGSIVIYARDFRELGRWVPSDAGYVIGRYMFEAENLPQPWVSVIPPLEGVLESKCVGL